MESIKWGIDHDYKYGWFLLSGDYKDQRFTFPVYDGLFGLHLKYAKWCITRRYRILYPDEFKPR